MNFFSKLLKQFKSLSKVSKVILSIILINFIKFVLLFIVAFFIVIFEPDEDATKRKEKVKQCEEKKEKE